MHACTFTLRYLSLSLPLQPVVGSSATGPSKQTLRYHLDELGPDFVLSLHRLWRCSFTVAPPPCLTTCFAWMSRSLARAGSWVAAGSARVSLVIHNSPLDICRSTRYEVAGDTSRAPDILSHAIPCVACVPLQPPVEVASASVAHGRWCVVVHLYRLVGPGRNCCCSCCKHVGKLEHMRVLGRWRLEPPPQVTMLDVAVCS